MTQYRLGVTSKKAEKDLGVLVGNKLNMNQQCAIKAKKTKHILGYISNWKTWIYMWQLGNQIALLGVFRRLKEKSGQF